MVLFQQLTPEIKTVFLHSLMCLVCPLIESLFAFTSKIDKLSVLRAAAHLYLFGTCHQESAHLALCGVGGHLPDRQMNAQARRVVALALDC